MLDRLWRAAVDVEPADRGGLVDSQLERLRPAHGDCLAAHLRQSEALELQLGMDLLDFLGDALQAPVDLRAGLAGEDGDDTDTHLALVKRLALAAGPSADRQEPSGKRARIGIRRPFLSRTRTSAPVAAMSARSL